MTSGGHDADAKLALPGLPHAAPCRVVRHVVSRTPDSLTVALQLHAQNPGYNAQLGGVPAWLALEYLGQTAAAWIADRQPAGSGPPAAGMLVSCRVLDCHVAVLPASAQLTATVTLQSQTTQSLVLFSGQIHDADRRSGLGPGLAPALLAEAQFGVYMDVAA